MKGLKIVGRKLIISNSDIMKPPLNASKVRETAPVGALKKGEPSKKHVKLIEVWLKTSYVVKIQIQNINRYHQSQL